MNRLNFKSFYYSFIICIIVFFIASCSDDVSNADELEEPTIHWVGSSSIFINEILPLNLTWKDENGDDGSWVELYNASSLDVNLSGLSLVENLKSPRKWVFASEVIPANSYRIVFCDKKNVTSSGVSVVDSLHARTHTNWNLGKKGGTLYLVDKNYGILDSVDYPELSPGVSYGKTEIGFRMFGEPTPELSNEFSIPYDRMINPLDFSSVKSGFYNESVTITPPLTEDGVNLHCSQDGSIPTINSSKFDSPITITKSISFRCIPIQEGSISKKVYTRTFFIDETPVKMPIVAISVDSSFFKNHYIKTSCSAPKHCADSAGLYADVEFPIHVEYFENGSASKGVTWEMDAGISLMGGYSRLNNKKSVSVRLRDDYEDGSIKYPLFETRKGVNDNYRGFNLRNNGNRFVSDYIEDAMGGALLEGSGVDYQRSRQVVVFYNGNYYGIHDMRERYNKHYVETNYKVNSNSVTMVKHLGKHITASNGTIDEYLAILSFVAQNSFASENNANYKALKEMVDVGNFADYMAAEIYMHNGDWPNNNVRAWKSPEHLWKFMIYDLDHGFDWMWGVNDKEFKQSSNMFSWIKKGGGNNPCKEEFCFANLYIQLIQNPDFRRMFINRSAVIFNSYTNGANVERIVDAMTATIDKDEMSRDLKKFKQDEKYYENSCGSGFSKTGSCLKSWAKERDIKVISEYQTEFGLGELINVNISSDGYGMVLMEGMILPSLTSTTNYNGMFFSGIPMQLEAFPTNGSIFAGWSDGVMDNPRIVMPVEGAVYTAIFK